MIWEELKFWKWFYLGVVASLIFALFTGCKSKEYITVPEYHTQYIIRTDTLSKTDSIYQKDSIYVLDKGDTVYITKTKYKDRYQYIYKVMCDTVIKKDSIPYPVERQLTKNEQRLIRLGKNFIWLFLFIIAFSAFFFWYKNKK